jgi:hypothetical protein
LLHLSVIADTSFLAVLGSQWGFSGIALALFHTASFTLIANISPKAHWEKASVTFSGIQSPHGVLPLEFSLSIASASCSSWSVPPRHAVPE